MTTNSLPTPKGPGHPKLRDGRFHVNISSATDRLQPNGKPVWKVHTEGRFVTEKAARLWAEGMRKPGDRASITRYSKIDGFRPHAWASLTDEGWDK